MIYPQLLLDVHAELIVDLFAGGGGASCGIEMATGRQVDVAINHDAAAVAMHRMNHPQTDHHVSDVFEVDPREVTQGRPIGLLWASPDCTDHSKAKGGKPIRNRKRRALAWVVKRWAGQVRPRVIALENVEEFVQWGPLVGAPGKLRRDERRRGKTFRRFVRELQGLGYTVEWRELRACDYGAPTIRKRLFLVARCDGEPIVWPEPTHGTGRRKRYRTAADCIDWSIPMLSIFATPEEAKAWGRLHGQHPPRRPLAEKTMARIARGVVKFVLEAPRPFIVPVQNTGWKEEARGTDAPLRTITANPKGGGFALAAPYLVPRYGERDGQEPRIRGLDRPAPAVVPTGNGGNLVAAFLAKHFTGVDGVPLDRPAPTVTTIDHNALVAAHLQRDFGRSVGQVVDEPAHTITPGGSGKHALLAAFLQTYYGVGVGQEASDPMRTIPTRDRMGLVVVEVAGEPYVLADIAMRMLQPRELYRAQGFPDSYVIERGADGRIFTKTEMVRMVGNSVSPQVAAAIVAANCPELVARDEAREAVA